MARKTISEQLTEALGTIATLRGQLDIVQEDHTATKMQLANVQGSLERVGENLSSTSTANLKLQERLADAEEKLAKVQKELESKSLTSKYNGDRADRAEAELEQLHAVLDGVAGAPTREYEQEYGRGKRTVVTRLTGAFLAIVRGQQ